MTSKLMQMTSSPNLMTTATIGMFQTQTKLSLSVWISRAMPQVAQFSARSGCQATLRLLKTYLCAVFELLNKLLSRANTRNVLVIIALDLLVFKSCFSSLSKQVTHKPSHFPFFSNDLPPALHVSGWKSPRFVSQKQISEAFHSSRLCRCR